MLRQVLSFALVFALLFPSMGIASSQNSPKPSIKEQVLAIPTGTIVEVRTTGKERVRGRLGDATDQGFKIQVAQKDKVQDVTVDFQNAKSVKVIASAHESSGGNVGKTVGWIVIGALSAVGVLALFAFLQSGR